VEVVVLSERDILKIIIHVKQKSHYIDVRPCSYDADRKREKTLTYDNNNKIFTKLVTVYSKCRIITPENKNI
jgi:hypothetical protein